MGDKASLVPRMLKVIHTVVGFGSETRLVCVPKPGEEPENDVTSFPGLLFAFTIIHGRFFAGLPLL